jgi:two-component system OmpR family sensor kinase
MTRPDQPIDHALDGAVPVSGSAPSGGAAPTSGAVPVSGDPAAGRPGPSAVVPAGHFRWLNRFPLGVKLIVAMLALVALALLVIGGGSAFALRNILLGRIDGSLATAVVQLPPSGRCPTAGGNDMPSDYVVAITGGGCAPFRLAYQRVYTNGNLPPAPVDVSSPEHPLGTPYTVSSEDKTHQWRVVVNQLPDGRLVMIGEDLSGVDNAIDRLVTFNLLVGTAVLILLVLIGAWLVRVSLRPLVGIERTAGAIARGDLSRRVPDLDPDTELGRLSNALNTMLSQIEAAFYARATSERRAVRSEERMRQFVADASHELRTPLTTIRGFAELYRQGAAPDPADVLRRIEDEAARMGLLVEDLLMLARLDQERPVRMGPVELPIIIADAAAAAHAVAPDRTVEIDIAAPAARLTVVGDEARLRQIVGNLVTNAITHTPSGTPVTLRLSQDGEDHALIEVIDHGPGLSPEQAEHVFERFYRVDKARTRKASTAAAPRSVALAVPHSGAGLGLAIVAALVAAHNGTVAVRTAPGEGATFQIRLPLAPES